MNPNVLDDSDTKQSNISKFAEHGVNMDDTNNDEVMKKKVTGISSKFKTSDRMVLMKTVVTGPPNDVFKKRTVLPTSLLQSVTEHTRSIQKPTLTEHEMSDRANQKMTTSTAACDSKQATASCIGSCQSSTLVMSSVQTCSIDISIKKQHKPNIAQCLEMDDPAILKITDIIEPNSRLHNVDNTTTAEMATIDTFLNRICGGGFDITGGEEINSDNIGTENKVIANNSSDSAISMIRNTSIRADTDALVGVCQVRLETTSPNCDLTQTVTDDDVAICDMDTQDNMDSNLQVYEQDYKMLSPEKSSSECITGICSNDPHQDSSQDVEDPFGKMDVDDMTQDAGECDMKSEGDVYDISPLFTGDLEKWRRRELKKDLRRGKQKWVKGGKKKKSRTVSGGSDFSEGGDPHRKEKVKHERKPVPNYFVAIQITNLEIHSALKKVQDDVLLADDVMASALIKLPTLHLTMFVLHLDTDEEMTRAKLALDECSKRLQPSYPENPLLLDVAGLGNFRNSVVFAHVKPREQVAQLQDMVTVIEDCFLDQGLVSSEKGGFKPHITVMKLSRAWDLKKKGIYKIKEGLYKQHVDETFGQQAVNSLQLCAMLKRKDKSGYYQVEHQVQFGPDIEGRTMTQDDTESATIKHDVQLALDDIVDKVSANSISCHVDGEFDKLDKLITGEDIAELENLIQETGVERTTIRQDVELVLNEIVDKVAADTVTYVDADFEKSVCDDISEIGDLMKETEIDANKLEIGMDNNDVNHVNTDKITVAIDTGD